MILISSILKIKHIFQPRTICMVRNLSFLQKIERVFIPTEKLLKYDKMQDSILVYKGRYGFCIRLMYFTGLSFISIAIINALFTQNFVIELPSFLTKYGTPGFSEFMKALSPIFFYTAFFAVRNKNLVRRVYYNNKDGNFTLIMNNMLCMNYKMTVEKNSIHRLNPEPNVFFSAYYSYKGKPLLLDYEQFTMPKYYYALTDDSSTFF